MDLYTPAIAMRLPLSLLVFLFLPILLSGQKLFPLRSATDSIRFSVASEDGKLTLELQQPLESGNNAFPSVTGLRLEDGSLLVDYAYRERLKKGLDYEMSIAILPASGFPMLPAPGEVIGREDKNHTGTLDWPDRTERGLDYGQSYTLIVRKALLGEVDCEAGRPSFGIQQKWPYYATALVGAGMVGLGQVYRKDKEDAYTRYENAWRGGATADSVKIDLKRARDKDTATKWLTFAGWGLLAADALGFAWRWGATKRRQSLFDQYCVSDPAFNLTLEPCLLYPGALEGTLAGAGLRLRFEF
ncbi:MAG: hypothetical protein H6558_12820 [Lewinellaceae bacterium]|nr:hypothetical protein [Lewinellaceae bacterium]